MPHVPGRLTLAHRGQPRQPPIDRAAAGKQAVAIMAVICLVIAAKLIGDGISGLSA